MMLISKSIILVRQALHYECKHPSGSWVSSSDKTNKFHLTWRFLLDTHPIHKLHKAGFISISSTSETSPKTSEILRPCCRMQDISDSDSSITQFWYCIYHVHILSKGIAFGINSNIYISYHPFIPSKEPSYPTLEKGKSSLNIPWKEIWVFPKIVVPQNGWFTWKTL